MVIISIPRTRRTLLITAVVLVCLSRACVGRIIYVDGDATSANNGTSWANAYWCLQDALGDAQAGDEIRVANGIYKPDQEVDKTAREIQIRSSADRTATFQLITEVTIKGGYAGFGEPEPDARDIVLHKTILSGDLNANDGPDFTNNRENCYHVVNCSRTDPTAVLDGFTVIGGNANGSRLDNCGGGMYTDDIGNATIINCSFAGNWAGKDGGGIFCIKSSPVIENSIIAGNVTDHYGGGIFCDAFMWISNSVIVGNSAMYGGGIYYYGSSPTVTNCTIVGNFASGYGGGGIYCGNASPTVVNSILWNNRPDEIYLKQASINVTYSNVENTGRNPRPGEGNINANPLFVDADGADDVFGTEDDDLRLLSGSPCIDTGDNSAIPESILTDLDGNPRIMNGIIDMGAYEGIPLPNVYHVDAVNGDDHNDGLTFETALATIQAGIDAAVDEETVLVYPGLYQEEINFMGKKLTVQGVVVSPDGVPVLQNPGDYAVSFYSGEDPDSVLKNFIISDSFMGVFIAGSSPTISNLTIVNNKYGIEAYADSEPDISNCILWNNSDDDLFQCQVSYTCIERGDEGEGNITLNPLFVDPDNGDYHLRCERGRYWPEHDVWVLDKVTSPCIDGGAPNADPSDEPMPNGDRINMGAYGGTAEASLSPSGQTYLPPGKALNPSPADGAIGVGTDVILSWTASLSVVLHDVYFGTNPILGTAELVSTRQAGTTYRFNENLTPGTTFYWRVDEFDGVFTYKGDVWTFTVSHRNAFNPIPPDGTAHEDTWVNLRWSPGADAVSHNVYFSDNIQDMNEDRWNTFLGNQDSTSYILGLPGHDYPDGLIPGTTYYWRIDEVNNIHPENPSKGDVWSFTVPHMIAFNPIPPDGSVHEDTWIILSWSPGDYAVSHDVYFGENFVDVNNGAESTFYSNQTMAYAVFGFPGLIYQDDGLLPGTTYYWRIDEVNDLHPKSPWKGNVWSFSIPPRTAYFPNPADNAESVALDAVLSWTSGFGAKLHTVYFGDNFEDVHNATGGFPQGTGTYTPGPLELAKTYYWRVDEFDGIHTHKGEIWSFITEGAVGDPNPSNGAVDVKQSTILKWTHGIYADSHQIYFGVDKQAVKNANTSSPQYKGTGNLGSETFNPGLLEWNTTYYWRIDEANNAQVDGQWIGPVWSFTTANFLIIDDFESYNDLDPTDPASRRIFNFWIDGFDNPAENGSIVGQYWWGEQTIVHSGNQSMPFTYDNAVGKSEATLTLMSNRDWTVKGVDMLSIWYRGKKSNAAETMYVILNGSAGVDNDNPNATRATTWSEWTIDLQRFADQGVNLANVSTITIGFGNRSNPVAGGSGLIYFDDIRLYPPAP